MRQLSNINTLSSLNVSSGTLSPAFNKNTEAYTVTVPNSVTGITLTPSANDATATVTVNGSAVSSGSASGVIPLTTGSNSISTVVSAQDGSTKTYVLTVNRALSSNATLSTFRLNPGASLTAVSGQSNSYSASVSSGVASVTLTAVAQDAGAVIRINGAVVASGAESQAIGLTSGATVIDMVVTAENGIATKSYRITVTRTGSSNTALSTFRLNPGAALMAVSGQSNSYSATVSSGVSSVTLTAVVQDANASIRVNGTAVASGAASQAIALSPGATVINIVVTAEDGIATKTYRITVNKTAQYTASVTNKNTNIDVLQQPAITDQQLQAELTVHQAVSPNGDGINDRFTIDGIGAYPQNTVRIMNRNGDVIFTASGYDNYNKAFDGHAGNGTLQQAGTYFYSIEYKKGEETLRKTGYIVLKY